ncbi:MAG TPA: hypothetical protein VFM35_11820 [Candidatus Binatia bacterium]|nr:hypothetical protein [Candidatus Binatia bacterium]
MIDLLLAILGSASLPVLFRAFDDWRVNILWAIPANYVTCIVVGSIFTGNQLDFLSLVSQPWIPFAILQGIILAGNFFLLAYTAQRAGVSVAALASRLSVAIPSILAFVLYDDSLNFLKMVGLLLALLSLYLCTVSDSKNSTAQRVSHTVLPVLVFVTFGCYFSILKYVQTYYLDATSYHVYVMSSFIFAFLTSLIIVLTRGLLVSAEFRLAHLVAGVLLGLINYVAIYSLVRVLGLEGWESSQLFPIYSVGVVAVSSLLAVFFFRERLSRVKTTGLLIGIIAVALLNR